MIGLMIEIKTKGAELWTVFSTLAVRYAASAALALLFYFYTPFPLVTRQILALVVFSPVSALCPIFTENARRHRHGGLRGLYLHRHKRDSDDRLHGGHGDLAASAHMYSLCHSGSPLAGISAINLETAERVNAPAQSHVLCGRAPAGKLPGRHRVYVIPAVSWPESPR